MIQICSIGNKIKNGFYNEIHSKFNTVVNFFYPENLLVSIVNPKIGAGPYNIVLDGISLIDIYSFQLNDHTIYINKDVIDICHIIKTDFSLPEIPFENLIKNLPEIEKNLLKLSIDKSLVVLLNPEKEKHFITSVEKHFLIKFKEGFRLFQDNKLIESTMVFRGLGMGLTPSGDDFNAGVLTGLCTIEKTKKISLYNLKEKIFETAQTDNRISQFLLYICKNGLCNEKFKNLILAISGNDKKQINERINIYIKIGETSGSDFLTGFYVTVKKFL